MIKIYDLLFEQDNTSNTTSIQKSPEEFKEIMKTVIKDTVQKPLDSIQAWIKQDLKTKTKTQTSSNAESTTSTTTTKPTGPSSPAGVLPNSQDQNKKNDISIGKLGSEINAIKQNVEKLATNKNNKEK